MISVQKKMEQLAEKASKASLAKASLAKSKAKKAENKVANKVKVLLPATPDGARCVPNHILRSALFSVVKRGRRAYVNHTITHLKGVHPVHIEYTGEQLNQNDLDVWQSVLHFTKAKQTEIGDFASISAYEMLKIQKKSDCGKNRETLLSSIKRMTSGSLTIETENYVYTGSLIHDFIKTKDTKKYLIWINPRLKLLFEKNQYTLIDFQKRASLSSSLAQWLHGFYSTHANPYPYKISTLKELCGSEINELWKFRQQLKKAIIKLNTHLGWKIWIDKDLLYIKK